MSGIEIGFAVVGAVAALIAAYKDGDKILARIKKKRAEKGALPPSEELEKALRDGEADIKRVRDEGKHVIVDEKAASALKDLTIEVQASLLHRLAEAEQDDSITDFSSTIQTAIRARRKAINLLNDLYIRVEENDAKAAEPTSPPPPTVRTQSAEEEPEKRRKFWSRTSSATKQRSNEITSPLIAPQSPNITRNSTYSNITRRSTFSISSPPMSPITIQPLNKDHDITGFCKGAWYAQSLNLAKAVGKPSLRSYGWAFHCTKCSYTIQADVRDRNNPRFDDRVYKTEDMRFRLLFLLKSHLPQKKKEARKYGCLLCALAGASKKCTGESHLFEHLQNHTLQSFGDVMLAGPVSMDAEGVRTESAATYDIVFDAGDFALPPSVYELDATQSHESAEPLNLVDEMFGNVWA